MVILEILSVVFSLYIIVKREEGTYKILWLIVIMGLPVLGALLYLFVGNKGSGRRLKKKILPVRDSLKGMLSENTEVIDEIGKKDKRITQTLDYISKATGFPVYECDDVTYYPFGEDMFADMCSELEKAEKFVFIEYFIINSGKFWDTEAVKSYTYMFIEFWNSFAKKDPVNKELINEYNYTKPGKYNGYILPYYDSPIEGDPTSNIFFTEILSAATDYVYFYTPYLMLGDTLYDAFIRAAERGVFGYFIDGLLRILSPLL